MVVKLNLERMKRKKQRKPAMSLITNKVEEALGLGPFRHPQPVFTSNILIHYSILASLYAIHYRHLYQLLIYGTLKVTRQRCSYLICLFVCLTLLEVLYFSNLWQLFIKCNLLKLVTSDMFMDFFNSPPLIFYHLCGL